MIPKKVTSDAGTPLRNRSGREVIRVKTDKGLVPFSIKSRNIRSGKSMASHSMTRNVELGPKSTLSNSRRKR
jgi:hypothetical protein